MIDEEVTALEGLNYVSRGGQKLAKALDYFKVSPQGRVCIDCGASTGGFTDCLLHRGARYVYAIDVGYGQLAWTLRNDERVKVMERTNIRHVTADMLIPADTSIPPPSLAVIDVAFISLSLVLPVVSGLLQPPPEEAAEIVCLIKPQFEAGKGKVGKKGVVREPGIHKEVLQAFLEHAEAAGFHTQDITYSPVKGPKGNIEYLGHLTAKSGSAGITHSSIDIDAIVADSHRQLDV